MTPHGRRHAESTPRASDWRSSPPSGNTCRTPSTWATGSWSAIPGTGAGISPPIDVVSLYVDQKPEGDQSELRAREFGFHGLSDDRRGAALRRRQAGRRRRR